MIWIPNKTKPHRLGRFFAFLAFSGAMTVGLASAETERFDRFHEARYVMGTVLEITVYHHDGRQAREFLDEAFSIAQRLDDLLSNYKPESEINRLNRKAGAGPVKVSPALYNFLKVAKSLSEKTDGAFDITIGPLVDLWRQASDLGRLPSEAVLKATRSLMGSDGLVVYPDRTVELKKKGMRLETGGIGKGYAVDRIAELTKNRRIDQALINFGHSSILAVGNPPHAAAWSLLLQFPGEEPLGVLAIKDRSLSASSTLGRSFDIKGTRYGHLIDPKAGTAVSENIQAVVMARSASFAEALSKYLIFRGGAPRHGHDPENHVAHLRLDEDGDISRSEDFPTLARPDRITQRRAVFDLSK